MTNVSAVTTMTKGAIPCPMAMVVASVRQRLKGQRPQTLGAFRGSRPGTRAVASLILHGWRRLIKGPILREGFLPAPVPLLPPGLHFGAALSTAFSAALCSAFSATLGAALSATLGAALIKPSFQIPFRQHCPSFNNDERLGGDDDDKGRDSLPNGDGRRQHPVHCYIGNLMPAQ